MQVLKGLIHLHHERHIIHRDLKPSNILINHRGEVKISDFGVSAIISSSSGRDTFTGTYNYMAVSAYFGFINASSSLAWNSFSLYWFWWTEAKLTAWKNQWQEAWLHEWYLEFGASDSGMCNRNFSISSSWKLLRTSWSCCWTSTTICTVRRVFSAILLVHFFMVLILLHLQSYL